ncbi:MAG: response regulator [Phycisphaerae bacterium]|nr:MAG: DNA-binding response regulator [Planctomycetota bacterium]KAB2942477.1 MAG: response regulator transcription factor [Phycisphaerae bacterium]MBE7456612.1 response regulator transcription factor [Planctomycetia bacterium]MCK6464008.1 LuxR C-terminal-related transcriptional regulator [Phycisphaerae bacterium]MCL4718223.1 response regulator [Phycisphaerae bacterium]
MFEKRNLVAIVDEEPSARESLGALVGLTDFPPAAFETPGAFLASSARGETVCVLLDLRRPFEVGLEVQRSLRADGYEFPIVFISRHADVPAAVQAMKDGAFDVLVQPVSGAALRWAIEQAVELDAARRSAFHLHHDAEDRLALLTTREREVLARVVAGDPNKRIAFELGISIKTVEAHRARVMRKMQAGSLPDLVRMTLHASDAAELAPASCV